MRPPRVLLTGATGFIGVEVARLLHAQEIDLVTIGRSAPPAKVSNHVTADLLRADVADTVSAIGATHLLHLAWFAVPGRYWTAAENLDWAAASLNLFRAFAAGGGQRVVFAGSCAEYAWDGRPCDERKSRIAPATLYGAAKAAVADLLDRSRTVLDLSAACGRIFFPFGPHERPERLLGSLVAAAARGTVARLSPGTQRRDFIHVEDVAEALIALLFSSVVGPVNIGSGEALPVKRFAEIAIAAAPLPLAVYFGALPSPIGEPAEVVANVSRLRDEVGFVPVFTTAQRIEQAMIAGLRFEATEGQA